MDPIVLQKTVQFPRDKKHILTDIFMCLTVFWKAYFKIAVGECLDPTAAEPVEEVHAGVRGGD